MAYAVMSGAWNGRGQAVSFDDLWGDEEFLALFCRECPQDLGDCLCEVDGDMFDARCERRGLLRAVDGVLTRAAGDVTELLKTWGCLDEY